MMAVLQLSSGMLLMNPRKAQNTLMSVMMMLLTLWVHFTLLSFPAAASKIYPYRQFYPGMQFAKTDSLALGVHLGPQDISAALITATGEELLVANVQGTDAYRAFIADSQANEGKKIQKRGLWYLKHNDSLIPTAPDQPHTQEVEKLFAEALSQIEKAATEKLGQSLDISSIAVPQHFNETSMSAVSEAALKHQTGIIQPWQIKPFFRTAQTAYGLNSCESFQMGTECDIEEDTHLMLFIDCNDGIIDMVIADVDSSVFHVVDKRRLEYGEKLQSRLKSEIEGLIGENTDAEILQEEIRAVVFSGNASPLDFQHIRDAIAAVLPNYTSLIRDSIDPRWVGAVGAAQWARRQVEKPVLLYDIDRATYVGEHDEL